MLAAKDLGLSGFFLVTPVLRLLGASPDVIPLATSYLQIVTLGLFSLFGFSVFIGLMRGYGALLTPALIMLMSVVLNIIIDPFEIFGWLWFPTLGIEGAAIATVWEEQIIDEERIEKGEAAEDLAEFEKTLSE